MVWVVVGTKRSVVDNNHATFKLDIINYHINNLHVNKKYMNIGMNEIMHSLRSLIISLLIIMSSFTHYIRS